MKMKKLIILSLAVFSGLIYSNLVNAETGIQIARAKAKTLSDVKRGTSRPSSSGSGSSTAVGSGSSSISYMRGDATYYGSETKDKVEFQKAKPHPLRNSCAELWNSYYEKEEINIKVSTRGNYDEQILFFCPTCTDEEHFVKPFTESEYQGMTGMDRIKSCGYDYAVFKGGRGFNEVILEVPKDEN
jgi:hypothetical protein